MRRRSRASLLALTAVLFLGVTACGDDADEPAETGTTTTTAAPEEETTTTAADEGAAPELQTIEAIAVDYAYQLDGPPPTLAPGLVRIELTNEGTEEHQATLIRLNDGVTLDEFAAGAGADDTGVTAFGLFEGYGGPNAAAPGGGTASSTQALVAGNYLMICFIPSPSDGVPHAVKGMLLPFTVEGDDADASLPDNDVAGEIELDEFGFAGTDDFSGQGTFTVTNNGEQQHEATFYALADGATLDDALAFFGGESSGPPPVTPAGGLAAIAPGLDANVELDLPPGEYALICFLPDTAGDGAPHFTKGMATQVTVT